MRSSLLSICLLAPLALSCAGSDSGSNGDPSADAGLSDTGTGGLDPCTPNPCTEPPAAFCDNAMRVTHPSPGTCTVQEGAAVCAYPPALAPCEADEVCQGAGECVPGTQDPCDYQFSDRASFLTSIRLGNQADDDECCFDFNGDGTVDNKLGTLFRAAAFVMGDINAIYQDGIDGGSVSLLLETRNVGDLSNDSSVTVTELFGGESSTDVETNKSGEGLFSVEPRSFTPGTMQPRVAFPAVIAGGVLAAENASFLLPVPFMGQQLDMRLSHARLEAAVQVGPNGKGLALDAAGKGKGAKLGGVVAKTDVVAAVNTYARNCECLTLGGSGDLILVQSDGKTATCVEPAENTCGQGSGCYQLGTMCQMMLSMFAPDVDLDGDGKVESLADGISVGMWFKATSATIDQVEGCAAD